MYVNFWPWLYVNILQPRLKEIVFTLEESRPLFELLNQVVIKVKLIWTAVYNVCCLVSFHILCIVFLSTLRSSAAAITQFHAGIIKELSHHILRAVTVKSSILITSITDTTIYVVCHPPVSAEQKLQPLCCYLLPAGGAAKGPSLQLPRRTEARRPPATTQHHRRTDCRQGNFRALRRFWIMRLDYFPRLPDQSSVIHTCTQEQTNGKTWPIHLFVRVFVCSLAVFSTQPWS